MRHHFLLPELVSRYVRLLRYYTGVDDVPPTFRLNPPTYREEMARRLPLHTIPIADRSALPRDGRGAATVSAD